jgi:hypothetical protein
MTSLKATILVVDDVYRLHMMKLLRQVTNNHNITFHAA